MSDQFESDQFESTEIPINFNDENLLSLDQGHLSPETKRKVEIWGRVTDPRKHDPKNFRYLVHAFNPYATVSQPLIASEAALSGAYEIDREQGDQSINLFDHPERLEGRVSLSMSLIDQSHTGTWGEGGIIVEAPIENIMITSPTDVGSHNSSIEFLNKQSRGPILTGDELLGLTSYGIYNEVVAVAKPKNGKPLKLVGFFIKVDERGQPTDPVIARRMRQHAERLSLPLVEIQVKGPYDQEMFEIEGNNIWTHFRGIRYNLGSEDPKFAFYASEDRLKIFFPSPQEIEEVINHLIDQGKIDEAQAQQIRENYKIADARRKSPNITYDPKTGEIINVTIKDGYGEDEIEYWIGSLGYCWRVNMKEYAQALRESFLTSKTMPYSSAHSTFQIPISRPSVLSVLESRKETMEPEEYEKLINFLMA